MKYYILVICLVIVSCESDNRSNLNSSQLDSAYEDLSSERYTNAIKVFTELIDSSDLPEAYVGRGVSYLRTGEYGLALADFNSSLNKDSKQEDALFFKSMLLFAQGETEVSSYDQIKTSNYIFEYDKSLTIDDVHYAKAMSLFYEGRYADTHALLKNLLNKTLTYEASDSGIVIKLLNTLSQVQATL